MKLNLWIALIFITSLGATLFVWNHAQTKAHTSIEPLRCDCFGTKVPAWSFKETYSQ